MEGSQSEEGSGGSWGPKRPHYSLMQNASIEVEELIRLTPDGGGDSGWLLESLPVAKNGQGRGRALRSAKSLAGHSWQRTEPSP